MAVRELPDRKWLCLAPGRQLLLSAGPSKSLEFAAYAYASATELARSRSRLEANRVSLLSSPSPIFGESAFAVRDPDGNLLVFGDQSDVALDDGPALGALPGRLQHLVVASIDCERMVLFYRDCVGFKVSDRVHNDSDETTACFLRSSDEHHSFAVFKAHENRLDHSCYETTDWNMIRDWADKFSGLNIPLVWGPGRHGPGNNLFLFINDPDGNWIEISAELEVVRSSRQEGRWVHAERTLNLWGRAPLRS
jgi:catechol 2,3-dioxygenase